QAGFGIAGSNLASAWLAEGPVCELGTSTPSASIPGYRSLGRAFPPPLVSPALANRTDGTVAASSPPRKGPGRGNCFPRAGQSDGRDRGCPTRPTRCSGGPSASSPSAPVPGPPSSTSSPTASTCALSLPDPLPIFQAGFGIAGSNLASAWLAV